MFLVFPAACVKSVKSCQRLEKRPKIRYDEQVKKQISQKARLLKWDAPPEKAGKIVVGGSGNVYNRRTWKSR